MAKQKKDPVLAAREKALANAKAERAKLPRGAGSFIAQPDGSYVQTSKSPAAKKHESETGGKK